MILSIMFLSVFIAKRTHKNHEMGENNLSTKQK